MSLTTIRRGGGRHLLLAFLLASCDPPTTPDPDGGRQTGDDGGRETGDAAQVEQEDAGTSPPPPSECNDGVDNDGDGLADWQYDPGCYGPGDGTEAAGPRAEEDGFTTFDFGPDSRAVYVSAEGSDANDGSSPDQAVLTLTRGAELVRDGHHDFLLLRRGDTWRDQALGRFKSGLDAAHPMVIASYGDSMERPRLELGSWLINHGGGAGSFLAIIGLHIVPFTNDPSDPMHTGTGSGSFRFVGGGSGILIEDCHIQYGEIVLQSFGDGNHYENVEIRRNVIERAYHADTCLEGDPNGNGAHRPSGMYVSHADHVTIEENVFDHNGWNPEEVPSACATIYNHNLYVNGHNMIIRNNVLARPSSINIKLRSDVTGEMRDFIIEGNLMVEGEIGISAGGNSGEAYRFSGGAVRNNVLTHIGRTRPTTRSVSWGVEVIDNDNLAIEDNYFLNQSAPGADNAFALHLINSDTNRDVTIQNNLFYRIQRQALRVRATAAYEGIRILGNTFADPDQDSCLVSHERDAFDAFEYRGNRYYTSAEDDAWFCIGGDRLSLADWSTRAGESDATRLSSLDFPDPSRDVESYAQTLGLEPSLEAFLREARGQSRLRWREELTAPVVNAYIRAGFE